MNLLGRKPDQYGWASRNVMFTIAAAAAGVLIYGAMEEKGQDGPFRDGLTSAAAGGVALVGGLSEAGNAAVQTGAAEVDDRIGDGSSTSSNDGLNQAGCSTPFTGMGCEDTTSVPQPKEPFTFQLDDRRVVTCGPPIPGSYNPGDAAKFQKQLQGTNHAWAFGLDLRSAQTNTHPGDGTCFLGEDE